MTTREFQRSFCSLAAEVIEVTNRGNVVGKWIPSEIDAKLMSGTKTANVGHKIEANDVGHDKVGVSVEEFLVNAKGKEMSGNNVGHNVGHVKIVVPTSPNVCQGCEKSIAQKVIWVDGEEFLICKSCALKGYAGKNFEKYFNKLEDCQ